VAVVEMAHRPTEWTGPCDLDRLAFIHTVSSLSRRDIAG
jgi:hypothetical protein